MKRFIIFPVALAIAMSVSCTGTGTGSPLESKGEQVSAKDSGHWYLAREDPPTMFPVGYPSDGKTEAMDGEWILGGTGVRWFVPMRGANGVSQQALTREAMLMRSSIQDQQRTWQKAGKTTKEIGARTIKSLTDLVRRPFR